MWTAGSAGEGGLSWHRACLPVSLVAAGAMGHFGRLKNGDILISIVSVPAWVKL